MSLPSAATKANLDAATDDPSQARAELVALIDKFNALLTALPTDFATAAQGTKADNALPATSYTAADVVSKANYTAADVLVKIKTVDGFGSGLDSELVQGNRIAHGAVHSTGAAWSQSGAPWTVSKTGTGVYLIVFGTSFSGTCSMVANIIAEVGTGYIVTDVPKNNNMYVYTYDTSWNAADRGFSFDAVGQN